MHDLMEKASRCQLHFSKGFLGASAVITFVSPLHKSFGMMPKTKRAVGWHREGQAVRSTKSLGLRVVSNANSSPCKLRASSLPLPGRLVSKMTCPGTR